MSDSTTMTERRWVAFGSTGAIGSISTADGVYTVRLLDDRGEVGRFPSLEIAKSALHAAVPGEDWPEFREH